MGMQIILLLMKLSVIAVASVVHGSAGNHISPLPAIFSAPPPTEEGTPASSHHAKSLRTNVPSPASLPNGTVLRPPVVLPPLKSAPVPQVIQRLVPSPPPSPPTLFPPYKSAPPPLTTRGLVSSMPPSAQNSKAPIMVPIAPVPFASPPRNLPRKPPPIHPIMPGVPPSALSVPVASPPRKLTRKPPVTHPTMPGAPPSILSGPAVSPISTSPPSISRTGDGFPVAAPPKETSNPLSPVNHSPTKGTFPVVAPGPHKAMRHSNNASAHSLSSPAKKRGPASSPSVSFHKHHHVRKNVSSPAPAPSYLVPPPTSNQQGPAIPPATSYPPSVLPKKRKQRHHAPPPLNSGPSVSPFLSPFPPSVSRGSPAPSPSPTAPSAQTKMPIISPKSSPTGSSPKKPMTPLPSPVQALPPPPPNEDCTSVTCTEPLTNTPPGSRCDCVWPMQVGLRLSVALYTFFPLVSELAQEIAYGILMKQSQVRIMGANAASQQPEKTVVLINLVPLGEKFNYTAAFSAYEKFWHKEIVIKTSFFGDYEVLYVRYPGLPPSPPSAPSSITAMDDGPYPGNDNSARTIHPLGVDVGKKRKDGLGGSVIAIIVLSSSIAVVLCIGAAWVLLLKCGNHIRQPPSTPHALVSTFAKPSGAGGFMMFGSGPSSASPSFGSSIVTYTGPAKTFSASEIERATDNFDASRILGEGGFGRVYSGILDDGMKVAVKVLKRDDQQGGREFLAEVEMLSRLHHRNLVKLIGICTEDHAHCLVYELIPNSSVESHLHGVDKETAPLDWGARMKIALGAARGLAYLHEDSSPRVIHRDFKSSNILLEHDFTPKVSDFGLARTALEEGNKHISTRVMGTFGYVAPEYAMTGHLLVKSDVYSYGVVLLELLTGRKPVDMSQPQGQENLVTWARPLLTSKEGLEMIIDPALGSNFPFDSVAKVAAIASMCVQPEVSHRPFMGEVVQALKLVCNECDETKEVRSGSCSQEDLSIDMDTRVSTGSGQLPEPLHAHYPMPGYVSSLDAERALSVSELFSTSARFGRQASGSFRRHSSSGPLRTGRRQFWQKVRGLSRGSMSEHGVAFRLWPGSH